MEILAREAADEDIAADLDRSGPRIPLSRSPRFPRTSARLSRRSRTTTWMAGAGAAPSGGYSFTMRPANEKSIRDGAVNQALQTIRNRIDQFGVSEPVIARQGLDSDRIVVQLPGVDDPERVKRLIKNTAFLEFRLVRLSGERRRRGHARGDPRALRWQPAAGDRDPAAGRPRSRHRQARGAVVLRCSSRVA